MLPQFGNAFSPIDGEQLPDRMPVWPYQRDARSSPAPSLQALVMALLLGLTYNLYRL